MRQLTSAILLQVVSWSFLSMSGSWKGVQNGAWGSRASSRPCTCHAVDCFAPLCCLLVQDELVVGGRSRALGCGGGCVCLLSFAASRTGRRTLPRFTCIGLAASSQLYSVAAGCATVSLRHKPFLQSYHASSGTTEHSRRRTVSATTGDAHRLRKGQERCR